ncbi:MAG TPA: AI-2E family transporter [Candidatus Portnoybacteria bacterium]|nr:AI-2E family transporter [Candidatus Portnoybacteria bacterium]
MSNNSSINISTSTIIRTILILFGFWVAFLIRDIILMLFLAITVASAVDQQVDFLEKKGIKRFFGVAMIYFLIILIVLVILYLIIPSVVGQVKTFSNNLSAYLNSSFEFSNTHLQVENITQSIINKISGGGAISNIFSFTKNIYQTITLIITGLVLSIYINTQESVIKNFLIAFIPKEQQSKIIPLIEKSQKQVGSWLRGELLLMFCVGLFTYLGLSLLHVKYALSLSVLAGFLEIIPFLGPILSAVPAIIVALTESSFLALLVLGLYIVVQELEAHILVPQVMKKSVGLNPVLIILTILIGGKLGGIMGAIVSIPLMAIGKIILEERRKM